MNVYTRAIADIGLWKRVAEPLARARMTLDGGGGVKAITGIAPGTPIVVTCPQHDYQSANVLYVTGVRGAVEADGSWQITVIDDGSFSLDGSVGTHVYNGGGLCVRSPIPEFDDPFARALGFMKVSLADPLSPADADFVGLSQYQFIEAIDIAEYEILAWMTMSLTSRSGTMTDQRWPDYSYRVDPQAVLFLQNLAADIRGKVRRLYGYDVAVLRYGSLNLGFQADSNATSRSEIT